MRHFAILFIAMIVASLALAISSSAPANEGNPARLFPSTTVVYAEIEEPKRAIDVILDHPMRARIERLDSYERGVQQPEFLKFKAIVSAIEAQLGMPWRKAITSVSEGGIYAGFDAASEGVALLVKARDEKTLGKVRDTWIKLVNDDARGKGNESPVMKRDYRGITAYGLGDAKFATFGSWLLVTNKGELGKRVLDNHLDQGNDTLANRDNFQAARRARVGQPSAWAYADLEALREAGVAKDLFRGQTENIVAELMVGGLLSNLQQTPFASTSLYVQPQGVRLSLSVPHNPAWVGDARKYYFGPDGEGVASRLIWPEDTVFSLSTYRDISDMWLHAGDLFDEGVNDELAKAESNLSTLFSGKDFAEEILGAFKPDFHIVVTRQRFGDVLPQPAIKLPAFAFVFRLKDVETMPSELRRTFQSLVGFLNVVGAMNGQPQLDLETIKDGNKQIVTATYVPESEEKTSRQARINFNFSPSVALVGDRFVLSSSKKLARALADVAVDDGPQDGETHVNTSAKADVSILHDVLDDNRNQLIAQNMLEDGNSKEAAETQIQTLLTILDMFRDASFTLDVSKSALELNVAIELAE